MKRVIIESPYGGTPGVVARNIRYARACLRDSLLRKETPFASHLLYTQDGVLDDTDSGERSMGIIAGFSWRSVAELTAVYTDLGMTQGMKEGIKDAEVKGMPVQYRELGEGWDIFYCWGFLERSNKADCAVMLAGERLHACERIEARGMIGQFTPNAAEGIVAGAIVVDGTVMHRLYYGITDVRRVKPERA